MLQATLTLESTNRKTGPIPVSSTSKKSCPPTCPLKGDGCYAEFGPMSWQWAKLTRNDIGEAWDEFCQSVSDMPDNQLWRHNQMGDLPGSKGLINESMLIKLVESNRGKRGFTYTHYNPEKGDNGRLIKWANDNGFTINLSANSMAHADYLASLDIAPVVTVLPWFFKEKIAFTPEGRKVIVCLAEHVEYMSCAVCKKCLNSGSRPIIGFVAHGTRHKRATEQYNKSEKRWRRITSSGVMHQMRMGRKSLSDIALGLGYKSMNGSTLKQVKAAIDKSKVSEAEKV